MSNAKEIKMSWDAEDIRKSLPKTSAFTFMDLLAMNGHAPVAVERRSTVSIAIDSALDRLQQRVDALIATASDYARDLAAPAYNYMSLLSDTGHVPAEALGTAHTPSAFDRLVHWAVEVPAAANSNEAQKVA